MKVTIKDVAKASGYSVATVSMALSNKPSRISKTTKQKIIKIAKDLNYLPNQIAVSLATKHSKMLGLIIADITNPHMSTVFMGIDRAVRKKGYVLICCTANNNEVFSAERLKDLIAKGVEGIILSIPAIDENSQEWSELEDSLAKSRLPIMSRDNRTLYEKGIGSTIEVNYEQGGYIATKHLLELGHKKIGCLAGSAKMNVTGYRLKGYRRALCEFDIEYDPKLVYYGDYEMESGKAALPYLLGQGVTGIFSFNDNMAFGLYSRARTFGIHIPQDLSIVGFDDVSFDEVLEIPLTSVYIHADEIGKCIAEEMIRLLEDENAKPQLLNFDTHLMVRGSTVRIQA